MPWLSLLINWLRCRKWESWLRTAQIVVVMVTSGLATDDICFSSCWFNLCLFDCGKAQASSGIVTWLEAVLSTRDCWESHVTSANTSFVQEVHANADSLCSIMFMVFVSGRFEMLMNPLLDLMFCRSQWQTGQRSLQRHQDWLPRGKALPRRSTRRQPCRFRKQRNLRRFGASSSERPTSATVFKLSKENW